MDSVQLSQCCRVTMRGQFTLVIKSPEYPVTHLINQENVKSHGAT